MSKSVKFWDKMANKADPHDGRMGGVEFETVEHTLKYLKHSDTVLDYACGTGSMTLEIANHVKEIYAADLSARMLAVVKSRAEQSGIENIYFTQGTIFDVPHEDGSLDVILAFNILHLLEDPRAAIQKINQLLKPGGVFISATACLGENTLLGIFLSLLSKTGLVPYVKRLTLATLGEMIANEGFQLIEPGMRLEPMNYFTVARKT